MTISGLLCDKSGQVVGSGESEMAPKVRFLALPMELFTGRDSSLLERLIVTGGIGSVLLETPARCWRFAVAAGGKAARCWRFAVAGGKVAPLLEVLVCLDGKALRLLERFAAGGGGKACPVLEALARPGGRDSALLETSAGAAGRVLLLLEMFSFRTLFAVCGTGLGVPVLLDEP